MAASPEPAKKLGWQQFLAVLVLLSGLGLAGWSFITPRLSTGRVAWSQEQARKYQATSAQLHSLSHEFVHAAEREDNQAMRDKLDKAQAEYDVLRTQLETAMARPRHIALLLRFAGVLLAAAGAATLYWLPQPSPGHVSSDDLPDFFIKRRPDPNDGGVEP